MTTRILFLLIGMLVFLGCHDNKIAGPGPTIPQNATRLFVSDCDPFNRPPGFNDAVNLVADSRLACAGEIEFLPGLMAPWSSNLFSAAPASYMEGARIVLVRPISESQDSASVLFSFHGLAVSFVRTLTIPAGQTRLVAEITETGTLNSDTTAAVSFSITGLYGRATLELGGTENSFITTEVSRTNLCELRIDQGLSGGIGRPNEGVTFANANGTAATWDSIYLDFTGGASVNNNAVHFGPHFGPVYVIAGNGICRDTAAFWAPATAGSFRVDTLGNFPSGNLISDGIHVWLYDIYVPAHDSIPCAVFRVRWPNHVSLIEHPIYDCSVQMFAEFDQQSQSIWIVGQYESQPDTAWSYSTDGHYRESVTATGIPFGHIYRGRWLSEDNHSSISRVISATLIHGGDTQTLGSYPTELTQDFSGAAGIGLPGAGKHDYLTVNVFDPLGNWVAAYPVAASGSDLASSVSILSGDSVIIYSVYGNFNGLLQQVRVLQPR